MVIKADAIYWDSCVFIDCLQHTHGRYDVLRDIVELARGKELRIVTSAFSIAEVVGLSKDRPVSAEDARKIKDFFENDFIYLRQVDRATVELAADIGRQHSIRPPDAVHIATAIRAGCCEVQTYDGLGEPTNKKKLLYYDGKIGSPALRIKVPSLPATNLQRNLPFDEGGAITSVAPPYLGLWPCIHPLRKPIGLRRTLHPLSRTR